MSAGMKMYADPVKSVYTSPVTSNKGVMGLATRWNAAQSRNPAHGLRLFRSCLQFWRPEWEGLGPAGFAPRSPVRQPVQAAAHLAMGVGFFKPER